MGNIRNTSKGGLRLVDTLLRTTGGSTATFLVSPSQGDLTDAGQVGLDPPNFQAVALQPVIFRRIRATMAEGTPTRYELLASASAVDDLVGLLQLDSAEALFAVTAMVQVTNLNFLIDTWGATVQLGQIVLYRLLLREAVMLGQTAQS